MPDSSWQKGTAGLSPLYLQLAELYEYRSEPKMRDRFLILAADAAAMTGQGPEAERLLQRLLRSSPHHMLKAFSSFAEAMQAEHIRSYVEDLRKNYTLDVAEPLLERLRRGEEPPPQPASWAPAQPITPTRAGSEDPDQTLTGLPPEQPEPFRLMPVDQPDDDQTQVIQPKPAAQPRPGRSDTDTAHTPRPTVKPLPPTEKEPPRARQPASQASGKPRPAGKSARRQQSREEPGGSWLSMMLFGVVLVLGLVTIYYALVRPFFHIGWLP